AAEHAGRRAHLAAYEAAVERLQREEFGGEDPLAPLLRNLLEQTAATERRYEELWGAVTGALRPTLGEGDWPPPLEDAALAEELEAEVEVHLRGDWGD
ncbi:MAG: hypothetical protein M3Q10_09940, partial [Chloroflexota bacterium]|nr:hypothetical protein [Chloroflexota bacterium]